MDNTLASTRQGATLQPFGENEIPVHDGRLVTSRYLRKLRRTGESGAYLYHSLFGNLTLASEEHCQLVEYLRHPLSISEIRSRFRRTWNVEAALAELRSYYYLVPDDFDERSIVRDELSERSVRLASGSLIDAIQLNVSEGCNIKCTYCFADRVDERASSSDALARNRVKQMSKSTALEAIDAISDLVRRNGHTALVVKFFGREPLLNWKTIEAVFERCREPARDLHYYFSITTNGTLITREIAERLRAENVSAVVSLDGQVKGNVNRLTFDGRETFSAVDRGLRLLAEAGVSYTVASVLSSQNFEQLGSSFIAYLRSHGVRAWELKLSMQDGGTSPVESSNHYARKLYELYVLAAENGIRMSGDWYDPFITLLNTTRRSSDDATERLAPSSCSASDHQLSIEPSGQIYPCRAMETHLGEIRDLERLFRSEAYRSVAMRTYSNVRACHSCKLESVCQGVCLGHSEKQFGDIYQPDDAYCEIYRQVFDLLLQNYASSSEAKKRADSPPLLIDCSLRALGLGESRLGVDGLSWTPSKSVPSIGTPSIGTPSIGTPSIGTPSIGTPSVRNAVRSLARQRRK